MTHNITFTDEQLEELERMLSTGTKTILVEVHRTDNANFRATIQRRLELQEQILSSILQARHSTVSS